jgi:hypothetical protein
MQLVCEKDREGPMSRNSYQGNADASPKPCTEVNADEADLKPSPTALTLRLMRDEWIAPFRDLINQCIKRFELADQPFIAQDIQRQLDGLG